MGSEDKEDGFPEDAYDAFPLDKFDFPSETSTDTFEKQTPARSAEENEQTSAGKEERSDDPLKELERIKRLMRVREKELIQKVGVLQYSIAVGLRNAINGGVVGGVVGAVSGVMEGRRLNLPGPQYAGHVVGASLSNAGSFGGFLGAYTGIKCYMRHTRQKNDLINSFTAGTIAGMIGTLRSRSPAYILLSGASSGALMAAIDSFSPQLQ